MQKSILLLSLWLIAPSFPVAASENWMAFGRGAEGCGDFIERRRTPNPGYDISVFDWAHGFLSAYNFYGGAAGAGKQFVSTLSGPTVLAYLDKYCKDHPLASIGVGVIELIGVYTKR